MYNTQQEHALSVVGLATQFAIFLTATFLVGGFFAPSVALAAGGVNITSPATGASNISIDTTFTGGTNTPVNLDGPALAETSAGSIAVGTHTLILPTGWRFDTSSSIHISKTGGLSLVNVNIIPDIHSFSFVVNGISTSPATVIFDGLRVVPEGTTLGSGEITYDGIGMGEIGGSWGTLTTVAGEVNQLTFETQPSETEYGSTISEVVVKTQDQFGNDSANGASGKTVILTLSGTGTLLGTTSLDISSGTASFTDLEINAVGTKQLIAETTDLASITSDPFDITQKTLTATVTANDKTYNGNNTAVVTGADVSSDLVYEDAVTADITDVSAIFADANAGTEKTVTATGIVLVGEKSSNYSFDGIGTGTADINQLGIVVTPDAEQSKTYGEDDPIEFTFTNLPALISPDDFTGALSRVGGEDVGDYGITLGTLSASDNYLVLVSDLPEFFAITQKPLTVTAVGDSREYDQTTNATVTLSSTDEKIGDNLVYDYTSASFLTKTAENGKIVNVSGISIDGPKAGNYNLLNTEAITTANITKKPITATLNVKNKTYDGTTSASFQGTPTPHIVLNDVVFGDDITVLSEGTKSFLDKHVDNNKTVNGVDITLTGLDKDNYLFDGIGTGTANITIRAITITAVTDNKTYDGTISSEGIPVVTSSSIVGEDISDFIQEFDNKNVGTEKVLTPTGWITDENDGNNYDITFESVSTGEITKAPLTATVTVEKKVVNGTTDATIDYVELISIISVGDVIDDVTISDNGTATFNSPDVGIQGVTATGITLAGDDIGNYSFNNTATGTGEILPVPTTVYVDDSWAGAVAWTDPDEEGPATYFGYDAFATIQEGINAVKEGGTVNVLAGMYIQDLVITKELTLQGADKATTKIKGIVTEPNASFPLATPNIDIQADGVTISGFTIESPDVADGERSSGVVLTGQNITISNNAFVLIQAGTPPVSNDSYTSVAIQTYSKEAMPTSDVSGLNVSGNTFSGTPAKGYYGVYVNPDVGDGDVIIIDDNDFTGHIWRAITAERSNVTISGNTIANTDTGETWGNSGIRVVDWGTAVIDSVSITGNTITGDGGLGTGILFGYSGAGHTLTNIVVTGNTITGSDSGVAVHVSAEEVSVNENTIQNNTLNLNNTDTAQLDSTNNYWGTAVANTIDSLIDGDVDFDPYYVDSAKLILSSTVPSAVYVDSTYSDGLENDDHYFGYDAFSTIQGGIDAVATGGTVNVVAGGIYDEQIQIDKDITISGAGVTIIQPTGNDTAWDIQFIAGGSGATLEGFELDFNGVANDRAGRGIAVSDLNGPAVTNVTIQGNDITMGVGIGASTMGLEGVGIQTGKDADVSGLQILNNNFHAGSTPITDGATQGEEGIYVNPNAGIGAITISDNTFAGELFTGISVEANNVTISGNTVTGNSSIQNTNGIRVNDFVGSVAYAVTISGNNDVSGFENGIRLGSSSNNNSTLTISVLDNTISGNTVGILAKHDAVVTASENSISGNTTGAEILAGSDGTLNAVGNWWGNATGPTHVSNTGGTGDAVSDNVTFRPWYLTSALENLDSDSPTVALTYSANPAGIGSMTITATYSEAITGTPQISIGQQGTTDVDPTDMTVTDGTDNKVWTYDYTVVTANGGTYVDGTATVSLSSVNDPSGNIAESPTETTFMIDTVAPTTSVTAPAGGGSYNSNINITADASDTSGIEKVEFWHSSTDTIISTDTSSPYEATWDSTDTAEGVHTIYVKTYDNAGNITTSDSVSVTLDRIAPVVEITAPAADARVNAAKVITFTDGEPTAPECSINNSVWVTCTSGTTTLNDLTGFDALDNGSLTLYLRDTDTAGNIGTAQIALIKDTSAPSITSKTPSAGAVGIDPTTNIVVEFNEDVVITNAQVTLQKGSEDPVSTVVDFTSETKTATIDPSATLDNNSKYTVILTGVKDTVGNTLTTATWVFTTSASYSMTITTGWNLISLPVVPTDTNVSAVLGSTLDDATKIETVWKYDSIEGEWEVYHPGNPDTSSFSTMTAGEGYWINYLDSNTGNIAGTGNLFQEGNSTPPQKTLVAGWNLIGYYQLENIINTTATKALSTVEGQWTQLRTYNNTNKQFQAVTGSDTMKPGEGYWIFMKSSSYAPYLYGPGDID